MSKKKGTLYERELFHKFWDTGSWACIRSAGSGSTPLPAPDLIVGNNSRILAIECKAIKGKRKYFQKEEIKQLEQFSKVFGAESWVGIRFNNVGWYFLPASKIKKSKNGIPTISLKDLEESGIRFDRLIDLK